MPSAQALIPGSETRIFTRRRSHTVLLCSSTWVIYYESLHCRYTLYYTIVQSSFISCWREANAGPSQLLCPSATHPPLKRDFYPFSAVGPPPPRLRRPPTAEKGFLSLFGGGSASAAPPHPTHRWKGKHPIYGVCPLCTVGRDQFPRSIKLTPSSSSSSSSSYV